MSHLRVAYSFIGVASGYSYKVIMKLLETYKPKYGTWLSMDHPTKKDKELNYWIDRCSSKGKFNVYTKGSGGDYRLQRYLKEDYETTKTT